MIPSFSRSRAWRVGVALGIFVTIAAGDANAGIAFTSFRSGNYDVWVMNADGSGQRA